MLFGNQSNFFNVRASGLTATQIREEAASRELNFPSPHDSFSSYSLVVSGLTIGDSFLPSTVLPVVSASFKGGDASVSSADITKFTTNQGAPNGPTTVTEDLQYNG